MGIGIARAGGPRGDSVYPGRSGDPSKGFHVRAAGLRDGRRPQDVKTVGTKPTRCPSSVSFVAAVVAEDPEDDVDGVHIRSSGILARLPVRHEDRVC